MTARLPRDADRLVRQWPTVSPRRLLLPAALVAVSLTGCGDDDSGDAERFCGEVAEHRELLTRPDLAAADDPEAEIDALLAEYRRIGEYAPLAVEAHWDQLTVAYEAADQVIPDDRQSEQEALEAIFRAEKAAVEVVDWLRTKCGVKIGPVKTIVPEVTTTVGPDTTEAP